MKENKIQNTEVKISKTKEMNDRDYLNDCLETIKNLSVNMATMLNEMSNDPLFLKVEKLSKDIKLSQRTLFELAFSKGFYKLEKAEKQKIKEKQKELQNKLSELDK